MEHTVDPDNLLEQSTNLLEVMKLKQNMQKTLSELTFCKNIASLSKNVKLFRSKVMKASCAVMPSSLSTPGGSQTLLISIQNLSGEFVFDSKLWQFCISMDRDRTQCTWNLDTSLGPGQSDSFCCPFNYTLPLDTVSIWLKFIIQFDSKTYTRSFNVQDCIIDTLHCLDVGRSFSQSSPVSLLTWDGLAEFCADGESTETFPTITTFTLRLDDSLLKMFIADILIRDSVHRGFSSCMEKFVGQSSVSVYYGGNKIDIILKNDRVLVKCGNPRVLCAVKASLLRRLAALEEISVDSLDDDGAEKILRISLQLNAFEMDSNPNTINAAELAELYLELRDVSEMIRFGLSRAH